jgi:excisionase family DNA binding protein
MTKRRYVTAADAAEYLGLSLDALYKRVRAGEVPASRLGRSLRFDLMELDLLMRRQRVEAS